MRRIRLALWESTASSGGRTAAVESRTQDPLQVLPITGGLAEGTGPGLEGIR